MSIGFWIYKKGLLTRSNHGSTVVLPPFSGTLDGHCSSNDDVNSLLNQFYPEKTPQHDAARFSNGSAGEMAHQ